MIEYDNIYCQLINQIGDLKNFARAQEGGGVGYLPNRTNVRNDLRTSSDSESFDFGKILRCS
jgi:hypothetical protein